MPVHAYIHLCLCPRKSGAVWLVFPTAVYKPAGQTMQFIHFSQKPFGIRMISHKACCLLHFKSMVECLRRVSQCTIGS